MLHIHNNYRLVTGQRSVLSRQTVNSCLKVVYLWSLKKIKKDKGECSVKLAI